MPPAHAGRTLDCYGHRAHRSLHPPPCSRPCVHPTPCRSHLHLHWATGSDTCVTWFCSFVVSSREGEQTCGRGGNARRPRANEREAAEQKLGLHRVRGERQQGEAARQGGVSRSMIRVPGVAGESKLGRRSRDAALRQSAASAPLPTEQRGGGACLGCSSRQRGHDVGIAHDNVLLVVGALKLWGVGWGRVWGRGGGGRTLPGEACTAAGAHPLAAIAALPPPLLHRRRRRGARSGLGAGHRGAGIPAAHGAAASAASPHSSSTYHTASRPQAPTASSSSRRAHLGARVLLVQHGGAHRHLGSHRLLLALLLGGVAGAHRHHLADGRLLLGALGQQQAAAGAVGSLHHLRRRGGGPAAAAATGRRWPGSCSAGATVWHGGRSSKELGTRGGGAHARARAGTAPRSARGPAAAAACRCHRPPAGQ